MGLGVKNRIKNSIFHGDYVGHDLNVTNIIIKEDAEREFVVTHNSNIKPVSYFTGRDTELKELRQRIEDGRKSILVSGMGGIGKTHICRKLFEEYVNKHAAGGMSPFRYIGYIEYSGDMNICLQKCLKFKQQNSAEQNQEAAWRELEYLASDGKLLLFIDNVDKSICTDPSLHRLNSIPGAVILTSRQALLGDEFETFRIGFLSMEQCKEIYGKIRFRSSSGKIKLEEMPDLEYVIEKLAGRHTITVELLAHMARIRLWGVKRLRKELEEKGFCLKFHKDGELVDIQKSYEVLYDLAELTEAEQNILEAFSMFPYISLESKTCNQWLFPDAGVSEEDDILVELYQKGWLQFDVDQECYSMHPVFAQFIYKKCMPKYEAHHGLIEACQNSLKLHESDTIVECQQYIPFVENILDKLNMDQNSIQADFLYRFGILLYYVAEYKKASKMFEKCIKIFRNISGEENLDTAKIYNNLAVVYNSQGKHNEAEELYKKSLQIYERVLGKEHPDTVMSYNNLAVVYNNQGKHSKAEELYEEILHIREKKLGEEHPDTAKSYNNLAVVYKNQGKYSEAEDLYKKSLQIREKELGEEHPDTAKSYNNLAVVYSDQGKYSKAEDLYKKSLHIIEKVLGEEHPDTAMSYNNLAVVYENQGKYSEAEDLYKKSLKIVEKVLGEENLYTAMSHNNVAAVYVDQGKYSEAEELYKKSLQIREKILGDEHPDTAMSYNNLAVLYKSQGEHKKMFDYYLKAFKVFGSKLGLEHLHTQIVYDNLKTAYTEWNPEGNFEQWLDEKIKEL